MSTKKDYKISSIEMRNLIFEALSIDDASKTPRNQTFKQFHYCGCISDLIAIVDFLAIERGLIPRVIDVFQKAWGNPGDSLFYGSNTNFTPQNLDVFFEELYYLINQNVISPGANGNYGINLPYFHVTEHGLKCLASREILPHDPDGFLARVKTSGADQWEEFYIGEALKCYNSGAWNASIAMLGLAGEYLAEKLIEGLKDFLRKNEVALLSNYLSQLGNKKKISEKYAIYEKYLSKIQDKKKADGTHQYPDLNSLKRLIDIPAKSVYATFLRLTRNEVAHPSQLKVEKSEALVLYISYLKYCEIQHKYLVFYRNNS